METINAVSTRGQRARGRSGEETNDQEVSNFDWTKIQHDETEISVALKWFETGFPDKESFKSHSQMVWALFINRELLSLKDGRLYPEWVVSSELSANLIVVPQRYTEDLLRHYHDEKGHQGITKSLLAVRSMFWSVGLAIDVEIYVKTCPVCIRRKPDLRKAKHVAVKCSYFYESVCFDIKTLPHMEDQGFIGYIVFIDGYTKLMALAPIKSHTTTELMSVLFRNWICRYGCPENLTSDNEGGFCGKLVSEFYALLGCEKRCRVNRKSEGNSLAETGVRLSKHILTALLLEYDRSGGQDRSWVSRLGYVEYCLNSTPSTSHGLSPWMVLTGSEMRVPSSLL